MAELGARRDALCSRLAASQDAEIRLHPNMAGYYRAQIADLRTALMESGRRMQAAEIVRKLIDRIELKPVIRQGRKTCRSASMATLPAFWRWRQKQKRRSMRATPR